MLSNSNSWNGSAQKLLCFILLIKSLFYTSRSTPLTNSFNTQQFCYKKTTLDERFKFDHVLMFVWTKFCGEYGPHLIFVILYLYNSAVLSVQRLSSSQRLKMYWSYGETNYLGPWRVSFVEKSTMFKSWRVHYQRFHIDSQWLQTLSIRTFLIICTYSLLNVPSH